MVRENLIFCLSLCCQVFLRSTLPFAEGARQGEGGQNPKVELNNIIVAANDFYSTVVLEFIKVTMPTSSKGTNTIETNERRWTHGNK